MKIYMIIQYFKDDFGDETDYALFTNKQSALNYLKDAIEIFKHNTTDIDECDIFQDDTFFRCYNPFTYEDTAIYLREEYTKE